METQKSNEELLEDSIKAVKAPQGSLDYRAITMWYVVNNLIDIVKNQQQQIELLQDQLRYHVEQVHKDEL